MLILTDKLYVRKLTLLQSRFWGLNFIADWLYSVVLCSVTETVECDRCVDHSSISGVYEFNSPSFLRKICITDIIHIVSCHQCYDSIFSFLTFYIFDNFHFEREVLNYSVKCDIFDNVGLITGKATNVYLSPPFFKGEYFSVINVYLIPLSTSLQEL